MNRDEFEQKLDVHGSDLHRWPVGEAGAARALLAADPACRALVEAAAAADAAVRQATLVPLDAALIGRIVAATSGPSRPVRRRLALGALLPAGALALALVAGLGFRAGYADSLNDSHELDLAALVVGDLDGLRTLP